MEQLPKIVQQRLQATAKAGVHPDPDLLTAFAEKSLNERERGQVLQHLGQCADCRNIVSLAMPEIVAPSTIPAKSPWLTWPVLRWGALAACVVVVTAAVTLHYERRQSLEPMVAEKAPAPSPPETLTFESKASNQPGEKLAAKIAPPSPFKSDRAFEAAGKLAKQRDGADMRSAAAASAMNGLTTDKLEGNRITDPRLANVETLKSADKPSESRRQLAAAPAPVAKAMETQPQSKGRNDSGDYTAKAAAETVTAETKSAPATEIAQATSEREKDESRTDESRTNESHKKIRSVPAGAIAGLSLEAQKADVASAQRAEEDSGTHDKLSRAGAKTAPRWTISADGALQRSFDSGRTWQTIPVADNVAFRALAANDSDIWVGGAAGALYHSSDAGQHWTRVKPVAEGKPLTVDIISVKFSDARHGSLTTNSDETWTTSDGGESWRSR